MIMIIIMIIVVIIMIIIMIIVVIVMMMIIILLLVELKSAILDFLQSSHCTVNCLQDAVLWQMSDAWVNHVH